MLAPAPAVASELALTVAGGAGQCHTSPSTALEYNARTLAQQSFPVHKGPAQFNLPQAVPAGILRQ